MEDSGGIRQMANDLINIQGSSHPKQLRNTERVQRRDRKASGNLGRHTRKKSGGRGMVGNNRENNEDEGLDTSTSRIDTDSDFPLGNSKDMDKSYFLEQLADNRNYEQQDD